MKPRWRNFLLAAAVALAATGCAPKRLAPRMQEPSGEATPVTGPSATSADTASDRPSGPAGADTTTIDPPPPIAPAGGPRIATLAHAQLGVPYRYGGATPAGFDCSGLVQYVYSAVGIRLPRTVGHQVRAGRSIGRAGLLPGDLVFFNTNGGGTSHVGIYISDQVFIHAPSTGKKVRSDSLADSYWRGRYVTARRILPPD